MARLLHRLGSFCARRRLLVIAVWALLVIGIGATVSAVGAQTNNDLSLPGTDSQEAKDLLADRFPPQQNGVNPIVFDVDTGTLTDDDHRQAVTASVKAMREVPHVYSVTNPTSSSGQTAGLLAKDQQTAFAPVLLDIGSGDLTEAEAQRVLDATEPAQRAGITVAAGGSIGSTLSTEGTETSEVVGIVAAMVILSLVLGSLVAMGLPIVTAVVGLGVALSVVGLVGHAVGIPSSGPTLATMIGLGVGIDYALFLITRHQDNLRTGMPVVDSVAQTVATSGSAVVFAGCTVVIALLSLGVAQIPLVSALGLASAIAVVAAVLVAVTLLPAFLGLLGHGIMRLALPRFLRPHRQHGLGMWARWAGVVRRHPVVVTVVSLVALVPLIIPVFSLELGQEDIGATSPDTTERQAYDLITAGFGVGYNGPLQVASALDPVAAPSQEYTTKYDQAQSLQKDLEQKQKQLPKQQQELEAQQRQLEKQQGELEDRKAELEREQDQLQRQGDELKAQQAGLEQQAAALERQQQELEAEQARLQAERSALERKARALAAQIEPLARELARLDVRARILQRRIDHAQGHPDRVARLRERLARVHERQAAVEQELAPLTARAHHLADQARHLQAQAAHLQQQAAALQRQADELQAQKATLEQQAADLQRQADRLQTQADQLEKEAADLQQQADQLQARADELKKEQQQAQQEKKQAEQLKKELTAMVTEAGGDPRGTDTRIVDLQAGLSGTAGVVSLTPPQLNEKGDVVLLSAVPRPLARVRRDRRARRPRPRRRPARDQRRRGHRVARGRLHGVVRRPRVADLGAAAAGDRHRDPARLRAADAGLPLAARPAPGSGHQPAVRGCGLRGAHRGVPVGLGHLAARHRHDRQLGADRQLRPADDVRGALRALDGLRGVPRQPRAAAPPRRRGARRGGALGARVERPDHHGRRADHGVGLRQLHPQRRPDDQAVRRRSLGGGPARRHPRGDAGARRAGAVRARCVVAAPVAGPAAAARLDRGRARARGGGRGRTRAGG